jgi:hypothetical protein
VGSWSERARETTRRGTVSGNEAGCQYCCREIVAGLGRTAERSYVGPCRCDPEFRGECSHSINQYYIVTGTSTVLRWEISKRRASTLECGRAAENPLEAQGDHIIGRSILPSRLQKFPCSFRSAVFTRKLLYYREVDANYIKVRFSHKWHKCPSDFFTSSNVH